MIKGTSALYTVCRLTCFTQASASLSFSLLLANRPPLTSLNQETEYDYEVIEVYTTSLGKQ